MRNIHISFRYLDQMSTVYGDRVISFEGKLTAEKLAGIKFDLAKEFNCSLQKLIFVSVTILED